MCIIHIQWQGYIFFTIVGMHLDDVIVEYWFLNPIQVELLVYLMVIVDIGASHQHHVFLRVKHVKPPLYASSKVRLVDAIARLQCL